MTLMALHYYFVFVFILIVCHFSSANLSSVSPLIRQIHLPRESFGMLAVSLRDTAGVKYAEDYVKLSVAQSAHIFPETVRIIVCVYVLFGFCTTHTHTHTFLGSSGGHCVHSLAC